MGWLRSLLIRGLIAAVLLAILSAGWTMHEWVGPEKVREALVAALHERYPDAEVSVESARLRIFGGISVSELKLSRGGILFFHAPSAIIHHDKEQLNRGKLVIRKLELEAPVVRIERSADGGWNFSGVSKPAPSDQAFPTILARNATIHLRDRMNEALPPLKIGGVKFSVLNDPLPLLKIDAQGAIAPEGTADDAETPHGLSFTVAVKWNRTTNGVQGRLEIPELAFTPELAPLLGKIDPAFSEAASRFTAKIGIKAELNAATDDPRRLRYDVKLDVREGRIEDPALPKPIERLTAVVRLQDSRITIEKGNARLGATSLDFSMETRPLHPESPASPPTGAVAGGVASALAITRPVKTHEVPRSPLDVLQDKLENLSVSIRDLPLDDELFAKLPPKASKARALFEPTGSVDASLKFERDGQLWKRELVVRPNKLGIVYEKFRYPFTELGGVIRLVGSSEGADEVRVQVAGMAGGRRVELSGRVGTEGPDPLIDLKIVGGDVPIDDKLFAALPPKYAAALGKLHASGRGDFVAEIRQAQDVNRCENTFRIRLYDGHVKYDHFPYSLERLRGHVLIRVAAVAPDRPIRPGLPVQPVEDTDRVEIREFEATHGGGKLWITGDNDPISGSSDRKMTLRVQGADCPVDDELRAAASGLKLEEVWSQLAPTGRLTFGGDIEVIDRDGSSSARPNLIPASTSAKPVLPGEPPFEPAKDLKLTLNFKGPSILPAAFPYRLDDFAGILRYQNGKVDLANFSARHGVSQVTLNAGEVRFGDGDEKWVNLGGIVVRPLVPDSDLLSALPTKIRSAIDDLKPSGNLELQLKHLVVSIPGKSAPVSVPASEAGNAPKPLPPVAAPPYLSRGQLPVTEAPLAAKIETPSIKPIVYWNAELKMKEASFDAGPNWRDVDGAIACFGRYEGDRLGAVRGNAWFDKLLVAKQPLTNVKTTFHCRPQESDPTRPGELAPAVFEFSDVVGTLCGGLVGGEARLVLDAKTRYRLWLTASDVQLEELDRANRLTSGGELRGVAQGKVLLETLPDPKTGEPLLSGNGQIDVPSGRMYNLPFLLPLLKLLKLQAPDQTAFEEAHASFELKGKRVRFTQLDLVGTAVSLGGSGETDLSGEEMRFEFYTIWSQALRKWLSTPLGDVTTFLSGNLFRIEVTKSPGAEIVYKPHMLPAVTEPFRATAERLRNRLGRAQDRKKVDGAK